MEQTGNMYIRDFGNCGGPCFNVGAADGVFLEGAIAKAAQTGASGASQDPAELDAQTSTGLKGHNAIGIVPGRNTRENIIVNAHGDGWFDAAGDNGDGLAMVMALARHFAKPENQPERTLVFVISGGHHSTGLNGPANFVKMNPELTRKTVLVLNLEHIAQLYFRPSPWRVEAGRAADESRHQTTRRRHSSRSASGQASATALRSIRRSGRRRRAILAGMRRWACRGSRRFTPGRCITRAATCSNRSRCRGWNAPRASLRTS